MNLCNRGRMDQAIRDLTQISRRDGWDDDDLFLWLTAPNSRFDDDLPPMAHLQKDPGAVIAAFEKTVADKW